MAASFTQVARNDRTYPSWASAVLALLYIASTSLGTSWGTARPPATSPGWFLSCSRLSTGTSSRAWP